MISMKVMVLGVILMLLTDGAFALKNVKVFKAAGKKVQVEEVARGLQIPWGFDFLSPHEMIVTERQGTIKRIKVASGQKTAVGGVPKVTASGQGGLLDIGLHPHFKKNRLLYLTYAAPFGAGHTTKLAMAKLGAKKFEQLKKKRVPESKVLAVTEHGKEAPDTYILARGNPQAKTSHLLQFHPKEISSFTSFLIEVLF